SGTVPLIKYGIPYWQVATQQGSYDALELAAIQSARGDHKAVWALRPTTMPIWPSGISRRVGWRSRGSTAAADNGGTKRSPPGTTTRVGTSRTPGSIAVPPTDQ